MNVDIDYRTERLINENDLADLYGDAGWSLYTRDIALLARAVSNSLDVITAWQGDSLVGLIRTIGDGESVIYIQDILVLVAFQRRGIGTVLLQRVLDKYKHVRQKALLTGNTEKQRAFYESLGFRSSDEFDCICFMRNDV
jgi:GNAT superfamily N-acetyltransferase